MTAKPAPVPELQKIWGYYTSDGDVYENLTLNQASDRAMDYKKKFPNDEVVIFRKVAIVENQPIIKTV